MSRASEIERQVRIELLRARAAVERDTLARQACAVVSSVTPASLLQGFLPASLRRGGGVSGSLVQIIRLLRRYPYVVSGASALLGGGASRRRRWLGMGAGFLIVWQVARALGGRNDFPD